MAKSRSELIGASKFRVNDYAKIIGCHRSTIYRNFKIGKNITPKLYFDQIRFEKAEKMLSDGLKLSEIYQELGFCDRFYFWRWFTGRAGFSPRRFQTRNQLRRGGE